MEMFPKPESLCCSHCFAEIKDAQEARKWEKICELFWLNRGIVSFKLSIGNEFQYLEENRYITTHETDKELLVKVNGINYEDSMDFYSTIFCLDYENHSRGVA